jgi:hypothetical protein
VRALPGGRARRLASGHSTGCPRLRGLRESRRT